MSFPPNGKIIRITLTEEGIRSINRFVVIASL